MYINAYVLFTKILRKIEKLINRKKFNYVKIKTYNQIICLL